MSTPAGYATWEFEKSSRQSRAGCTHLAPEDAHGGPGSKTTLCGVPLHRPEKGRFGGGSSYPSFDVFEPKHNYTCKRCVKAARKLGLISEED